MDKSIIEKGKMTEEGRLKIKEIRKTKVENGLWMFEEVAFGFLGLLAVVESGYFFTLLFNGFESGNGKLCDIFIALAPLVISYLPFKRVKYAVNERKKNNVKRKNLENEIINM